MKVILLPLLLVLGLHLSAQQSDALTLKRDFDKRYQELLAEHHNSLGVDYGQIEQAKLESSLRRIERLDPSTLEESIRVKYLTNVYNFLVIYQVVEAYPLESVGQVNDFFNRKHQIGEKAYSLNELEKWVVELSADPFTHLLLNCGAKSCPPLQYVGEQTSLKELQKLGLQAAHIVQSTETSTALSKIFFWNKEEFGTDEELIQALKSLGAELDENKELSYQNYDWTLNDAQAIFSSNDYYPTQIYAKGRGELKIFNNYYTQSDNGFRANFFSSIFQLLLGTNKNLNVGMDVKLRSVSQGAVSTFSALQFKNQKYGVQDGSTFFRTAISGIGPRIKYQPFKNKGNINFLHTVYFVPMSEAEGNADFGYADYNNLQIFNQVFIEKELSAKSRLFFDLGLHFENIKLGVHRNEQHFTPIQIPLTGIFNYYATDKSTFYGLATLGQRWDLKFNRDTDTRVDYAVYGQIGAGAKYFLTDFLEAELLYTNFLDTTPGRSAHTFNLGLRFFRI